MMTATLNITEQDIEALVDNQLEWEEAKRVLTYINQHEWAQNYYEQIVRQKKILKAWWDQRVNLQ
tara:strand:- start:4530 stop:4724 length:195 start_codon:yes stop_codon:yes gene_type:complete